MSIRRHSAAKGEGYVSPESLHAGSGPSDWSWRIEGDRDPAGTLRPPRNGMFAMIVEKKDDGWRIIAAQNTNAGPGTAPENEGLAFPIAHAALIGKSHILAIRPDPYDHETN